ncbi:ATP-binding cassette domain-containing protein, partial [Rhizobium ruizarguesonis]
DGKVCHGKLNLAMPLRDVSMAVRSGEILAIAGVAGKGQSELFDALSGEYPVVSAEAIVIRKKHVGNQGITARRLLGAGFVPE